MDDGFVRQHGQVVAFPLAEQGSRNWGDDVERFNQYPLYELGKALQKLDARRGDVPAGEVFLDIHGALMALNQLLGGSPFPLGFSKLVH